MSVFDLITLLGGLAMFLYGMRMMGDGLKESSSGTLKKAMERITNTPFKAFLLGLGVTAVIQSSTATIVITSGLVGAGIISLHQSLGIVIGANVGTTVTGQIIRLLDLDASSASLLQMFQPSTLAPVALIIGIILIMSAHSHAADKAGRIAIGFGILFSGLLNMTQAVKVLSDSGAIEKLFSGLGSSPILGYLIGVGVAFLLQSSSATIGILQAFSISGQLTFSAIYAVLVGIYLGDCLTTAIVCNIGAKPDAKRVGIVHILFNLSETVLILAVVTIIHRLGLLDSIWDKAINSGGIANTNTVFNLSCAVLLLPAVGIYEKLSRRLVRDKSGENDSGEMQEALNPVFFRTPALAFGRAYEVLLEILSLIRANTSAAFALAEHYDDGVFEDISQRDERAALMTEQVNSYLVRLSTHITAPVHLSIMNHYLSVALELRRLGEHTRSVSASAAKLHEDGGSFSSSALRELDSLRELLDDIFVQTDETLRNRSLPAAVGIIPLGELSGEMVDTIKLRHLDRLSEGACSVSGGTLFLDLISNAERIANCCANIASATAERVYRESGEGQAAPAETGETGEAEKAALREHYLGLLGSR